MKKLLTLLALFLIFSLLFTSCGDLMGGGGTDDTDNNGTGGGKPADHDHSYTERGDFDENTHWQICGKCDDKVEKPHDFGEGVTTKEPDFGVEGERTYTCSFCGFKKTESIPELPPIGHEHTFSDKWSFDDDNHWHEDTCGHGASSDFGAHELELSQIPGSDALDLVCECGYSKPYTDDHKHTYSDKWTYDEGTHWHEATCGHDVTTSPATHLFDDGIIVEEATEDKLGSKLYTCIVCGFSREWEYSVNHQHTFSEKWTYDDKGHWHEADCGHEGVTDSYDNHSMDNGIVTEQPTEVLSGIMLYTCTVCGYEKTETIPPQAHNHTYSKDWSYDGDRHWHESTCGCGIKADIFDHSFDAGTVQIPATEANAGTKLYTCLDCSYTKTVEYYLDGHEHTFELGWTADSTGHWHASTCGHNVKKDYAEHIYSNPETVEIICTTCKHSEGHDHYGSYEWSYNSLGHYHKSECGHDVKLNYVAHTFGTGSVVLAPTSTEDGIMEYTCEICSYVHREPIYAENHTHKYYAWDYDEAGHWQIASCGHGHYTEKTAHTWNDGFIIEFYDNNEFNALVVYTCTDCGYKKAQYDAHTHSFKFENDGNSLYHTAVTTCGNHIVLEISMDHRFDEGKVITPPDENNNGSSLLTCLDCGYTKTVTVEHDHRYADEWSYDNDLHWHRPLCGHANGDIAYHSFGSDGACTVCGYVYVNNTGLEFTLSADGTYYILTKYSGTDDVNMQNGDLVVPESYLGLPVLEIGDSAFRDASSSFVQRIVLPNELKKIGSYAFSNCQINVSLPSTVEEIGSYAFYQYMPNYGGSLESLPYDIVKIGDYAFAGVSFSSYGFSLPATLKTIGAHAFEGVSGIQNIIIEASVEEIGEGAFAKISVNDVMFGFNTFRADIFENSDIYGSLTFSEGCETVKTGSVPFSVQTVNIQKTVKTVEAGAFVSSINYIYISAPELVIGDNNFTLMSSSSILRLDAVKAIGNNCFIFSSSSYDMYLPEGLESIGEGSFLTMPGSSPWMTIRLPSTISSIGNGSFFGEDVMLYSEYWYLYYNGSKIDFENVTLPKADIWNHAMVSGDEGVIREPLHSVYRYNWQDDECHIVMVECTCHQVYTLGEEKHTFIASDNVEKCTMCEYEITHDTHVHSYKWTSDENNHCQITTCTNHDEIIGETSPHNFGLMSSTSVESVYKCEECGYVKIVKGEHKHTFSAEWSVNDEAHWHDSTCDHTVTSDFGDHDFDEDLKCTVCGYERQLFVFEDYDGESYEITEINIRALAEGGYYVINIPAYHNGLPVRALGDNLFTGVGDGDKYVVVTIPLTVEHIGANCFSKVRIDSIVIPDSVKTLGYGVFEGALIREIILGNGITEIPENAFYYTQLEALVIPEGVTVIRRNAFAECMNLKYLYLPSTIDIIEEQYGQTALDASYFGMIYYNGTIEMWNTSVTVDFTSWMGIQGVQVTCTDGIVEIGQQHECMTGGYYEYNETHHWTYSMCQEHEPREMNKAEHTHREYSGSWGSYTRCTCGHTLEEHYHDYSSEWSYDDHEHWHAASCGCEGLESGREPHNTDPVTGVCPCGYEPDPFIYYDNGDGTLTIENMNWNYNIGSITELVIPSEHNGKPVVAIGNGSELISGAAHITSILIPEGIKTIGSRAFYGFGITSLVIPDSVTYIGDMAFAYCSNLSSVTLGKGLEALNMETFNNCNGITEITIPGNIKNIYRNAIYSNSLIRVTVEEGVEYIDSEAFGGGYIMELYLPESLTYFGFMGCPVGNVIYAGTKTEFFEIARDYLWNKSPETVINCQDGQITEDDINNML